MLAFMADIATVAAARRALGPVGAFLPFSTTSTASMASQRAAVQQLERAGYPAAWVNEGVGGKDALVQLAVLLAATDRITFGTAIANIWARSPQTAHGAAAMLADAYPGRIVLGLGVGYPQQAASAGREFGRPLATMREFLDRMSAPTQTPPLDAPYARIIAANGPKMQALAAELTDGAVPSMVPPSTTAQARQVLGPDRLLVVLVRLELDASAEDAAALVRDHRDAGADHVVLTQPPGTDFAIGIENLNRIAPAVLGGAERSGR
jgi:probable F420-dependent oxidoreductase